MIKHFFIACFLLSVTFTKAQTVGVGASAIYNFQSESFGAGARGSLFPTKRLSFSPQVSYFFPFNKVTEYTIGLAVEYKVYYRPKFHIYGLIHGGYNHWVSYDKSALKNAKPNNWNLEGGIGISTNKCLRPFLEYRYNVKFFETHLNLGFLYIFGCKRGVNSGATGTECPTF